MIVYNYACNRTIHLILKEKAMMLGVSGKSCNRAGASMIYFTTFMALVLFMCASRNLAVCAPGPSKCSKANRLKCLDLLTNFETSMSDCLGIDEESDVNEAGSSTTSSGYLGLYALQNPNSPCLDPCLRQLMLREHEQLAMFYYAIPICVLPYPIKTCVRLMLSEYLKHMSPNILTEADILMELSVNFLHEYPNDTVVNDIQGLLRNLQTRHAAFFPLLLLKFINSVLKLNNSRRFFCASTSSVRLSGVQKIIRNMYVTGLFRRAFNDHQEDQEGGPSLIDKCLSSSIECVSDYVDVYKRFDRESEKLLFSWNLLKIIYRGGIEDISRMDETTISPLSVLFTQLLVKARFLIIFRTFSLIRRNLNTCNPLPLGMMSLTFLLKNELQSCLFLLDIVLTEIVRTS